ncbi:unnamed protein product [Hymenolepis diminuta]|uniref:RT_RNaseH domain-containing protein n=1 Tax=Hymenolepis diminuta TaxID=6216 RepID=A0A0R3SUC1_HYMDI|nr:unnamed protein product [Hymenolepis diminuta]
MLQSDMLLIHYIPKLPIVIAVNASVYGVGAVVSHIFLNDSEKIVAHASRSLTPAEKDYGSTKKEAITIVYGMKKFHEFPHGHQFTLLTDHQPLLSISRSKKTISIYSANRLWR